MWVFGADRKFRTSRSLFCITRQIAWWCQTVTLGKEFSIRTSHPYSSQCITLCDDVHNIIFWAKAQQNQQNDLCTQWRLRSAQSDQCLLSASWVAKDLRFLHGDSEDWSDWAYAQADLSLHWTHMPFCWFFSCCGSSLDALMQKSELKPILVCYDWKNLHLCSCIYKFIDIFW